MRCGPKDGNQATVETNSPLIYTAPDRANPAGSVASPIPCGARPHALVSNLRSRAFLNGSSGRPELERDGMVGGCVEFIEENRNLSSYNCIGGGIGQC
jgi:hypothetical protein